MFFLFLDGIDISYIKLNDTIKASIDIPKNCHISYVSIFAENRVGQKTMGNSMAVIFDDTMPKIGELSCPLIINFNDVTCSWFGFFDNESGIKSYIFGIGSAKGVDDIIPFRNVSWSSTSFTVARDENFVKSKPTSEYYATLVIINYVGLEVSVYSNPMKVDETPPITGWVIEMQDYLVIDLGSGNLITDITVPSQNDDVVCQRDISKVEVAWQEFVDDESGIDYYEVALGSTYGGTQVYDFAKVDKLTTRYSFTDIDLVDVRQVFVSVRGYNLMGLFSVAISNGVFISRYSYGLPPLQPLQVFDGHELHDM